MPYSIEQRLEGAFLLYEFSQYSEMTNMAASATIVGRFRVPRACTIQRMDAVYEVEAGTGPALTFELRTGTTVLFSSACTAAATMVSDTAVASGQSANRDLGDELNLAVTSANADNDFTGVTCQVWAVRRTA